MNLKTRLTKLEKIFPPRGRSKSELFAALDKLTFPQVQNWAKGLKTQEEWDLYFQYFEEFNAAANHFQSKVPVGFFDDQAGLLSETDGMDLFYNTPLGQLIEAWSFEYDYSRIEK